MRHPKILAVEFDRSLNQLVPVRHRILHDQHRNRLGDSAHGHVSFHHELAPVRTWDDFGRDEFDVRKLFDVEKILAANFLVFEPAAGRNAVGIQLHFQSSVVKTVARFSQFRFPGVEHAIHLGKSSFGVKFDLARGFVDGPRFIRARSAKSSGARSRAYSRGRSD